MPFIIVPITCKFSFPHEDYLYIMNLLFVFAEIILGFYVTCRFSHTQTAAFYRRTAPLLDKKFRKIYEHSKSTGIGNSKREYELGMRRAHKG